MEPRQWSALVAVWAMNLCACGTQPVKPTTRCPAPTEAMSQPSQQACTLRPELVNLELDDQLALIRGCHEADIGLLIETEKRRRTLAAHIKACE